MKKINKILALAVVFTMLTGVFSIQTVFAADVKDEIASEQEVNNNISDAAVSTVVIDGIVYELDDVTNTAKTINYFSAVTDVVIPDRITDNGNEYMVTTIGELSFRNKGLTSVEIPVGVTTIEKTAFQFNKLTSVEIPVGVTTIAAETFSINRLASVVIPEGVTSIGRYAFSDNQLTSVVIPESVTTIIEFAFTGNLLTSVVIPEGVTSMGQSAFYYNQLTSVVIPESVTTLEDMVFGANKLTSVDIPESVTSIGGSAFRDNLLTSVVIPESVISIGEYAFYQNQLPSVDIPESVTSIGRYAFAFNQLPSVDIPESVTTIEEGVFYDNLLTSIDIPGSITSIGQFAFYSNQLTSVVIPDSVTSIGRNAFAFNQLPSVDIPESVTTIEEGVFYDNLLTSINIPGSVTSIGRWAFYSNQLPSVNIPEGVTTIGDAAFGSNQLTNITLPSSLTFVGPNAFYDTPLATIFVPKLTDVPNVVNILDSNAMRGITVPYTSMYALDNIQGDYIAGTLDQYTLEYGQTQDLTVGDIYSPEIKRYDNDLDTWQEPQDNPINITDAEVEWYNQSGTLVGTGNTFTASETGTYHAMVNGVLQLREITVNIEANQYIVAFDAKGGTPVPTSQTIVEGEKVTEPTAPTKENEEFKGWYTDEAYTTQWDFNTPVTSAMTLYAKWEVKESTTPDNGTLPKTGETTTSLTGLMILLLGSSMLGISVLKKHKNNGEIK